MTSELRKSIEACAAHYGEQADAMREYLLRGEQAALALHNRGPIRFDEHGRLHKCIVEAYSRQGFYIFENVLGAAELADIQQDMAALRATFPSEPEGKLTADGLPALGADSQSLNLLWSKPLGDPLGGTELANGRHQVKLFEPKADDNAPAEVPFILLGSLQHSEACLRVYGTPTTIARCRLNQRR